MGGGREGCGGKAVRKERVVRCARPFQEGGKGEGQARLGVAKWFAEPIEECCGRVGVDRMRVGGEEG